MRGILIFSTLLITILAAAILLWLRYTRRFAQIPAHAQSYWRANKERRHSARIKADLAIVCNVPERTGNIHHLFSKDISGEGVCIQVPEILPEGSALELKVSMPNHGFLSLRGEVAWVKESQPKDAESGRLFDTGVKFTYIEPKDEAKFKELLHHLYKNQK